MIAAAIPAATNVSKSISSFGSCGASGHRNLTMLIRHYWRWINPGELSQATLARLGAINNSSNQPHPDPPASTRAFRKSLDDDARCQKMQQFGGTE
jgi:hypothetical protein